MTAARRTPMRGHLTKLLKDVAVYGVGDVTTSIVSFLLMPIYTRILSNTDLGVLSLLVSIEAATKILLRWGVDAAFMRLYYERRDTMSRQTLASSIAVFMLAANLPPFLIAWWLAPSINLWAFGGAASVATLRVFFLNTFLIGFFFIPFSVYRIEGRARAFTTLTFARSAGVVVLRLVAVVGMGLGVFGMVAADLIVTFAVGAALVPATLTLLRPRFSQRDIREALDLGLPRVPHGLAHQVIALADRWFLNYFVTLDTIGVYGVGVSLGLGMKLFLSAFEYAWAPFYLEAMDHPEAKQIYAGVTTFVTAILALLATGLAAVSDDLVNLMTAPKVHDARFVVPWVAVGVMLQGFYQLTAIGLNITKKTRTMPLATGIAMMVALGANWFLVPRYGMLGAAWTYALSYGALATAGYVFSQRVYPVAYDWRRIGTIVLAGVISYLIAIRIPHTIASRWRLWLTGTSVLALYPAMLAVTGFFHRGELARLLQLRGRLRSVDRQPSAVEETELGGEIGSTPSVVDTIGSDVRPGASRETQ